ncbi:MAG: nitrous oxide reductase accessory protein NosL [Phycisphaerales bacterium]|nr:nitrous oxide reductase accessory protein NosL [Phycisphaerales bacterium]
MCQATQRRPRPFHRWLGYLPLLLLFGCGGEPTLDPPTIHYGQDVCDVCGMIVSDERFAAAEVVIRGRRVEVRIMDDTGEIFQLDAPDAAQHAWWVHDCSSLEWVDARDAIYLQSVELRTPMALHLAAFSTREAAAEAQKEHGGEILTFTQAVSVAGPP